MSNHFTLFDIQPKFDVDLSQLEKKYIELSKTFHPDNCALTHEKSLFMENTININKAYAILKSPLKRAEYLLNLFGAENIDKHSPEILEESMQIRESIFDGVDRKTLIQTIDNKIKNCIENLKNAFADKDLSKATIQSFRLKYLNKSYEEVKWH